MRRVCGVNLVADRKSTRLNSSHTVIYTLSLHDALPISCRLPQLRRATRMSHCDGVVGLSQLNASRMRRQPRCRSEEHTSELQSHSDLHSFPTRRSSDLLPSAATPAGDAHESLRRRSGFVAVECVAYAASTSL